MGIGWGFSICRSGLVFVGYGLGFVFWGFVFKNEGLTLRTEATVAAFNSCGSAHPSTTPLHYHRFCALNHAVSLGMMCL